MLTIKRAVKMSYNKVTSFLSGGHMEFSCGLHGYFLFPVFLKSRPSKHEQSSENEALFGLKHTCAGTHVITHSCDVGVNQNTLNQVCLI